MRRAIVSYTVTSIAMSMGVFACADGGSSAPATGADTGTGAGHRTAGAMDAATGTASWSAGTGGAGGNHAEKGGDTRYEGAGSDAGNGGRQGQAWGGDSSGGEAKSAGGGGIGGGGGAGASGSGGGRTAGSGGGTTATPGNVGGASAAGRGGGSVTAGGGGSSVTAGGGGTTGGDRGGASAAGGDRGAGGSTTDPGTVTVDYTVDASTIFANPERGFYHHMETRAAGYSALDAAELTKYRTDEAVSLILRMFYLESFRSSPIGAGYLDGMATDLNRVRSAGLKAILRFSYTDKSNSPYGDASRDTVIGHIAQLAPILRANADIILTVQAGFIGAWGEWYYTDYFGDRGSISDSQWGDRRAVVEALLGALPASRTIQLRTPAFKQHLFGSAPLTSAEAFSSANKARVGHHNDCFLASEDDMGTYGAVAADKAYLASENLYVPQGGETCATSSYSGYAHADSDMAALHYSYLNRDYHEDVLNSWGANIDTVRRRLGYRLALERGKFTPSAQPGGEIGVALEVRNEGYAAPMNGRSFEILLRSADTGALYAAPLAVDPRRFAPGTTQRISGYLCTPQDIPLGTYDLLLAMPDPEPTLHDRPEYAIRLANPGLWEPATGRHALKQAVTISASGGSAGGSSGCRNGSVVLRAQ